MFPGPDDIEYNTLVRKRWNHVPVTHKVTKLVNPLQLQGLVKTSHLGYFLAVHRKTWWVRKWQEVDFTDFCITLLIVILLLTSCPGLLVKAIFLQENSFTAYRFKYDYWPVANQIGQNLSSWISLSMAPHNYTLIKKFETSQKCLIHWAFFPFPLWVVVGQITISNISELLCNAIAAILKWNFMFIWSIRWKSI